MKDEVGRRTHRPASVCLSSFILHPSSFGVRMDFRLPALGEGIDSATVVGVRVKPGDAVAAGQDVIDVETDKAAMAVPAEVAGTVEAVHVKPGDKVRVGGAVLTLTSAAPATPQAAPKPQAA